MTNEEKQLLLKDLCARLPYHVRVKIWLEDGDTEEGYLDLQHNYGDVLLDAFYYKKITKIKPYLRPLQSMTEDEIEMYFRVRRPDTIDVINPSHFCRNSICAVVDGLYMRYWYNDLVSLKTLDWLNTRHFDYRGLIKKKLALEAPEGMNNTKTE